MTDEKKHWERALASVTANWRPKFGRGRRRTTVLVFKLRKGQAVRVGDARVVLGETHKSWVKLFVEAPRETTIFREETAAAAPEKDET